MENLEKILAKLEEVEKRLENLEKTENKNQQKEIKHKNTIQPKDMEVGRMAYVGNYQSDDKTFGSIFGADGNEISRILDRNSFEIAKVVDAFSNEDRIDILKLLLKKRMSPREIMDSLNFPTTGKLYHHISYLEKLGIITKERDEYYVTPKNIAGVLLIFSGAVKISYDINE